MKFFCLVLIAAIFASGCAGKMTKHAYIDEFGSMDMAAKSLQMANDSENWKDFDVSVEAVFCTTKKTACTKNKVYQVSKYLPKKFLGYRYVIFKNDAGKENVYLLNNLPRNFDRLNIEKILRRIDP